MRRIKYSVSSPRKLGCNLIVTIIAAQIARTTMAANTAFARRMLWTSIRENAPKITAPVIRKPAFDVLAIAILLPGRHDVLLAMPRARSYASQPFALL